MGRGSVGGGLVLCAFFSGRTGRLIRGEIGRVLWKARRPAGAEATRMTYEVAGTQYVLICAGGTRQAPGYPEGLCGGHLPGPGEGRNTDG